MKPTTIFDAPASTNRRPRHIHRALATAVLLMAAAPEPLPGQQLFLDIHSAGDSAPTQFTRVENQLFFTAADATSGRELWVSDGTGAGTNLVKDIQSGSTGSNPGNLIGFDGRVFFTADDGVHGRELWVSDGTDPGTRLVADIHPQASSAPYKLAVAGGQLFFVADDGVTGYHGANYSLTSTRPPRSSQATGCIRLPYSTLPICWERTFRPRAYESTVPLHN